MKYFDSESARAGIAKFFPFPIHQVLLIDVLAWKEDWLDKYHKYDPAIIWNTPEARYKWSNDMFNKEISIKLTTIIESILFNQNKTYKYS